MATGDFRAQGPTSDDGPVCRSCGGAIPATMVACPVCEPDLVLSSGSAWTGGVPRSASAGRNRSVPLAPALAVLRVTPTLLLPPLLAVGAVAAVGTHWMGRVEVWPFWLLEMFLLLAIMAVALVAGIFALTFARAITVTGAVNVFAGVDWPVATAVRQVARRLVSVASWTLMHGMTALALAVSVAVFSRSTLRMRPGYDGVRNSQYVWQVMFGEDAGLARAMDRSAALVRAGLGGSRRFSLVLLLLVAVAGIAWAGMTLADGIRSGFGVPWLLTVTVITGGVAAWSTLADIIDTAAWRLATTGAAPPPFRAGQLGTDLDGVPLPGS